MAVRGGAGVGKSHFISTMSEANLGRLCIFDTERKGRLLRGVGESFDALEIQHTDELPGFIDWALSGEGQEQNYGCYALDSWATYFSAKHSEMLEAVREKSGNPLAQPSSEELTADQMILQNVLRKLCIESGKCVVIADQIPAQGKETKENNEIGQVLPMTASGLEYFVDVLVEISLQERDGEIVRVFQVMKSNSSAFEIGFEMTGNVGFNDFLAKMKGEQTEKIAFDMPQKVSIDEFIEEKQRLTLVKIELTIEELIENAEKNGFKKADVLTGAKIYHNQPNIYHLTNDQILDLDKRMSSRVAKTKSRTKGKISKKVA